MKRGRGQWAPHDGETQIKTILTKREPPQSGEILVTRFQTSSKQGLLGNRQRTLKVPGIRGGRPAVDGGDL